MSQDYKTHRRWVPLYHFITLPLALANVIYGIYLAITAFSVVSVFYFSMSLVLLFAGYYARAFALAVQDRLIRLEETLRLHRLLPDDLKDKISGLTVGQLIGLRFASDAELADIVRKTVEESITDRETIKQLVASWRADYARA